MWSFSEFFLCVWHSVKDAYWCLLNRQATKPGIVGEVEEVVGILTVHERVKEDYHEAS